MTKQKRQELLQKINSTIYETIAKHDKRRRQDRMLKATTHYKMGMTNDEWRNLQMKWNRLKLKDVPRG